MSDPDIVERLRTDVLWHQRRGNETIAADCRDAAAEITRLRADLAQPAAPDDAKDAQRYRTMLANMAALELRTEGGSTLCLNAKHRGEAHTRRGTDAVLDGLAAAPQAPQPGAQEQR